MAAKTETSFGDLLRRYRVAAGLTQEELAERASLSARGISDLERGARSAPQRHPPTVGAGARSSFGGSGRLSAAARRPLALSQWDGADPRPTLPVQPTPLVGRTAEVAAVSALL